MARRRFETLETCTGGTIGAPGAPDRKMTWCRRPALPLPDSSPSDENTALPGDIRHYLMFTSAKSDEISARLEPTGKFVKAEVVRQGSAIHFLHPKAGKIREPFACDRR